VSKSKIEMHRFHRYIFKDSVLYDVVEKTSTRRRSRITCVVDEKILKSRQTFNKNSCDLFTAI